MENWQLKKQRQVLERGSNRLITITDQCCRFTCVEFRCVHRPHDRVDLPPRSYTKRKITVSLFSITYASQNPALPVLLEISPFTRGVWGFLVTTLAVALLTWGDKEQDRGNDKGELCRILKWKPTNSRRLLPHLDLSPFHNCSIQLFSRPVSLSCAFEGDKPKALCSHKHLLVSILFLFMKNIFKVWLYDAHLWPPLIEDNFYIKDLAKLLKKRKNVMFI